MGEETRRVLVVDDDADVALFVKTVLERRIECVVQVAPDGTAAVAAIPEFRPDVVVTDIEMPGLNGLELLDAIRSETPWLPVVVMTAHVSVDYAVSALRAQADEFLTKPLDTTRLVEVVSRLADEGRARRESTPPQEFVLAIGAHPDDVEIGVGGILAAHRAAGDEVTVLTLSRGARGGDADDRQYESLRAADLLGARRPGTARTGRPAAPCSASFAPQPRRSAEPTCARSGPPTHSGCGASTPSSPTGWSSRWPVTATGCRPEPPGR